MLSAVVVDANILFSALIKPSHNFKLISGLHNSGVKLYSPQFVFEEIQKREEKILRFSKLNAYELKFVMGKLLKSLEIVSEPVYESFLEESKQIFPEHLKDVPYFALCLSLNSPLWSNEKLHKKQSKVKVYSTSELITELNL